MSDTEVLAAIQRSGPGAEAARRAEPVGAAGRRCPPAGNASDGGAASQAAAKVRG